MVASARPCTPVPPGNLHGKEGSTVRVRQRALQRPRKTGLLLSGPLARSTTCGRYGALYGASRSRSISVRGEKRPHCRHDVASAATASPGTAALSRRRSRVRVPSLPRYELEVGRPKVVVSVGEDAPRFLPERSRAGRTNPLSAGATHGLALRIHKLATRRSEAFTYGSRRGLERTVR